LADAPRSGRPDTFTAEQICALIALACEKPEDHGRPITHWTARELKDQVIQAGILSRISVRQVNRVLHATDLQPHRTRYWLNAKPDPQKEEKIRALCALYRQAQDAAARGELTFSVDEMTGIQALARIAPDHPMKPGQPVRREFEYERHGTLSLLAGLEVASGKVQAYCRPTRNEADFLELVDGIVQAHLQAVRFTFVLDNLNTHQSESLVRYVARDAAIAASLHSSLRALHSDFSFPNFSFSVCPSSHRSHSGWEQTRGPIQSLMRPASTPPWRENPSR
jgi:hypothetical protein